MEGFLLVPPERNTIIGRAIWKSRYVCLGPDHPNKPPPQRPVIPRRISGGAFTLPRRHLKFASQNVSTTDVNLQAPETTYLSIYKQQGDTECVARYPLDSIKSVRIEDVAHRKPSPIFPTLVVTLDQGLSSSKRWSSQSGSVMPIRPQPNTLLFRTVVGDAHGIQDWYQVMQNQLNPRFEPSSSLLDHGWEFTNPSRTLKLDTQKRYGSSNFAVNGQPSTSLLSPSPSVRSMRSELSSSESDKKSFYSRGTSELPSPVFEMPLTPVAEGNAAIHIGSGSPSSMYEEENSGMLSPSSPRRETILDRVFMMNCVPGVAELATSPEQNSVERFEALMRNLEARKSQQPDARSKGSESSFIVTPTSPSLSLSFEPPRRIPTPTKRVLEFISSGSSTPSQSLDYCNEDDYDGGDDHEDNGKDDDIRNQCCSSISFYDDDEASASYSAGSTALGNPTNSSHLKCPTIADFSSRRISTGSATFMLLTHSSHSRQSSLSSIKHDHMDDAGTVRPIMLTARPLPRRATD